MAILDDFTINTTLKTVRHTSGTTVYSVNALYSAIKDFEDDAGNMDDQVIMTAQTNVEYSIVNGWFIDNPSTNFLNGGALTSIGYLNEIQRVVTTNAGTDPIASDIGKVVTPATTGTAGELLHFDLDENDDGTQVNVWYVRSGDTTAYTGLMTITAGTGSQTPSTSVDGEEIWTNVFSFGTITATVSPQFYIEQQLNSLDHRVIEWVANSNFSRGNMDVLLRTQVEGTAIDGGDMLITIRQPGTTYDSSEQTLNGGRNPFALNAADDPDNLSAEYYILFDGETGTDIAVGDTITADSKAWYAEVVEVAYFVDTATGYLGLRGLNESIDAVADNDVFTSSGTGTASVNGVPGDRIIAYDTQTGEYATGLVMTGGTSSTKAVIRGIQDVAATGYLVLEVNHDFRADSTYYTLFTDGETMTDSATGSADANLITTGQFLDKQNGVSGFDDIDVVFHHGELVMASNTLTVGMHVTQVNSGATGVVTSVNGLVVGFGNTSADFTIATADIVNDDDSGALGTPDNVTAWVDDHTTTRAFTQGVAKNYDVIIYLENNTVSNGYQYSKFILGDGNPFSMQKIDLTGAAQVRTAVEGQFYLSAFFDIDTPANTYDKIGKRTAPLGNFAGGKWFCARGIWLEDVASADANNLQLLDSDNVTQNPPVQVIVSQGNTISGDRIFVVEDDGTGKTDKTTYNSHASNNTIGRQAFDVDGTPSIRADTPTTGFVRAVDDSGTNAQTKEHRYKYDSFSGDIFTLTAFSDSTGTAGAGGLTHTNSGRDFTADGVEVGMMVRNVTDGSIGFIATVGTTTFTVKQLEGGTENDFDTSDVVEINKLVVAYVAADTAYVPYIDRVATGTTESVTVIFAVNRNLIGKARNKGVIFAFVGTAALTNAGATITTVRTADGIAT